jgi:hypothetical protein
MTDQWDDERDSMLTTIRLQQERLVKLEQENAQMFRCLDAISACRVCVECQASAHHTVSYVKGELPDFAQALRRKGDA